ncbi:MAG: arylformamidase [Pyrinomonadaceae bacterium]|jgi:arylformamidase|nr:arylformamidase [Pyrinomonadaceae bacterium]
MTIYDISVPLSAATPTYPSDPAIEIKSWSDLERGDHANVSLLHFGAHSGTHVDAPAHFIAGGSKVEALPLESLMGEVTVVEVPLDVMSIDADFVSNNCNQATQRVLFKTRNSSFWNHPEAGFRTDYTYLEAHAARRLTKMGIRLVGIDYLSIEQYKSEDFETHLILLSKGVVILEGVDLSNVSRGRYELICLPLRIAGGSGDGAPARAVLRTLA